MAKIPTVCRYMQITIVNNYYIHNYLATDDFYRVLTPN